MQNVFKNLSKCLVVVIAALALLTWAPDQSAAQYYKGKTVTLLIGHAAGGGIDRMARVFIEKLGDFLPGNPTVVVKTMPGAGGNKALNFVFSKGAKDGTLLWFGPVNFLNQAIGSKGIRYDYAKFELIGAIRVPPVVLYTRTDIVDGGLQSVEDLLKAKGLKLAGRSTNSNIDIQGRTALDLLGVSYKYVTGYRGGAKARLALQSGEVSIDVTGLANYRTACAPMVNKGVAKGLWYYPYFDSNNQPIKSDAITDMPHFVEVYRKMKGKDPEGPAWEALNLVLEYRSLATNMFMMPPRTDKEAVDLMRKGWSEMMNTDEIKARQMKILKFTAEVVPRSAAEKKIKALGSMDQARIANYKNFIAAGTKK